MLAICPGCDEIHDGISEWCDHCFTHGLCDTGRERGMQLARLLLPQPNQREYVASHVERMDRHGLEEIVMRLFQYLSPVERSVLVELVQEMTDTRFRDGRKPCR